MLWISWCVLVRRDFVFFVFFFVFFFERTQPGPPMKPPCLIYLPTRNSNVVVIVMSKLCLLSFFLSFFCYGLTRPAASMRPPCLIYLPTSKSNNVLVMVMSKLWLLSFFAFFFYGLWHDSYFLLSLADYVFLLLFVWVLL